MNAFGEMMFSANMLKYYAGSADKIGGKTIPVGKWRCLHIVVHTLKVMNINDSLFHAHLTSLFNRWGLHVLHSARARRYLWSSHSGKGCKSSREPFLKNSMKFY